MPKNGKQTKNSHSVAQIQALRLYLQYHCTLMNDERTHVSNQVLGGNENKRGRFDEVTAGSLVLLFGIICAIK